MQTHIDRRRRNRVYKSLRKPLTYLGVERTLFEYSLSAPLGIAALRLIDTLAE